MPSIKLSNNVLYVDEKPVFVYSGEMHYFRVKKGDWKDRIKKAKQANLNTISSYIPWRWHEPIENKFDFKGKTFPERDLVKFLELLYKEKMYFIARIGPVCNGEIISDGLPEWLFEKFPDIRLQDYAGKTNPYSSLIDYHHPTYHMLIQRWYSQVIPIIQKYLVTNGGNIILIQLDNEISMLNWLTKSPTYSIYSNELFHKYLLDKYNNINDFNLQFNTNYTSFNEIEQPKGNFEEKKGAFYFEWEDYYREFYALFFKKLHNYLSEYNIEIPVIANIPQIYDYDVKGRGNMGIMTTSMFKKFGKYVDKIIFGGAYQYRRVDYENFHDITAMSEIVRMITPKENPMICAEMQTGVMSDRPVLYPSDVELNIKTSVATGLNGINGYMFVGGLNFLNMGGFGTFHNWQAAVMDNGKLAPHYYSVQETGEILHNFQALITEAKSVNEINLGLYLPYYQTEYLKGEFPEELMRKRDQKLFDGLLRMIRLAGFNYKFINLKDSTQEEINHVDNLWIFCLEFMDKDTQNKIVNFMEKKKNVLFYPRIPVFNNNFNPCEVIKNFLKINEIKLTLPGANRMKKPKSKYLYYAGDEVYTLSYEKDKKIRPLFLTEDEQVISILKEDTQQKIVICGFDLYHRFDYEIEFC